jgi:hypothetical protein
MKGLRFMSLLYLFKNKTGEGCSSVETHEFSICNKSINTKPYRKTTPLRLPAKKGGSLHSKLGILLGYR